MRTVRVGLPSGLVAQAALLVVLAGTLGLDPAGWLVGIACGGTTYVLLARALGGATLTPADQVTLARATIVGGVAALVADTHDPPGKVATLVALCVVALVLDGVDGWVARRTSVSTIGARFDMEVDAFLILVLSLYVSRSVGSWVLVIGLARYAYVVAGRVLPWLREPTPPRYWAKVVAAIQGIVLTLATSKVLPGPVIDGVLLVALLLLAESFGQQVWWLRRHRQPTAVTHLRTVGAWTTSVLAFVLVWVALVAPDQFSKLTPGAFARIPIEGLVIVVVALFLPSRPRVLLGAAIGVVLGLLAIVKLLDMGFFEVLDRPFNPVVDWGNFGPAVGVVRDSIGEAWTVIAVSVAGIVVIALLVLVTLSVVRLTRVTARHRSASTRTVGALGAAWVLCAVFGAQFAAGAPIASSSALGLAVNQVDEVRSAVQDQRTFGATIANDPFRYTAGKDLLTGLRGKDVLIVFVESYGRVAVQDTAFSPPIDALLDNGTSQLAAAGFSAKSAFLISPTFGGISWLAHSTLQTGLWIDNQQRYNQIVSSDRFTLSDAFKRAGWRTVADIPSNTAYWPEGTSFYHYDKVYDDRNVAYAGPRFSYARIPDQYTLNTFQNLELKPNHAPVMAEIDLVSSHTPWTPLPQLVDWNSLGDGSVYDGMPQQGRTKAEVWRNANQVKASYGQSIQYSLSALISFVQTFHDPNLVMVMLGDHQPATIVSGSNPGHDVPISIIAHDPKVLSQISSWGWQDGLLPSPAAPVWPMDAFRDRFLSAYGSASTS